MRIELARVEKQFGKLTALHATDLALPAGAKVALIGPNGSGKTTLIRVLLGLVQHRGKVVVDGAPVRRLELAPRIAYVPQIAPQMAASCGDLVRAVSELRGLTVAAVHDIAARLDLRLDDVAGRPFRSLSGGSKQKLLIALALAARPELLILDEPTASLDAEARGRFFELQRELAGDATLILCSHRLEEIRSLVDHVVALEEGRLVYDGDAASYLAQRVGSLLELRVTGEARGWLAEHGFAPGANGWWSRSVDREAKLALVPAALGALGADLVDLVVRDVDLIELRGGGRHVPT
ncbi:MAG: transporter ATP-binding protein [Deltaproteobacteria bacterium]|nr:transporter ATP-binding protein [Deltaproteobacteria bacterium]